MAVFAASADPLHKVGSEGAWQHEQSGWLFSRRIADFDRMGAPWEIDGTTDVGAEYQRTIDGRSASLTVSIYATDSQTSGASLPAAQIGVTGDTGVVKLQCASDFPVDAIQGLDGRKMIFAERPEDVHTSALYYFSNDRWVVQVRAAHIHRDDLNAVDEFVRSLEWHTLGTDAGELDGG
jgi:hypothetical protein